MNSSRRQSCILMAPVWFWQVLAAVRPESSPAGSANLIDNGVNPDSILAITFTNKAAQEMRARVAALIPDYSGHWIQTFHAACYKILRMDINRLGYDKSFAILGEGESKTLMKEILKEEHDYESKPEELLYAIKQAKNSLLNPETYFNNLELSQPGQGQVLSRFTASTTPA